MQNLINQHFFIYKFLKQISPNDLFEVQICNKEISNTIKSQISQTFISHHKSQTIQEKLGFKQNNLQSLQRDLQINRYQNVIDSKIRSKICSKIHSEDLYVLKLKFNKDHLFQLLKMCKQWDLRDYINQYIFDYNWTYYLVSRNKQQANIKELYSIEHLYQFQKNLRFKNIDIFRVFNILKYQIVNNFEKEKSKNLLIDMFLQIKILSNDTNIEYYLNQLFEIVDIKTIINQLDYQFRQRQNRIPNILLEKLIEKLKSELSNQNEINGEVIKRIKNDLNDQTKAFISRTFSLNHFNLVQLIFDPEFTQQLPESFSIEILFDQNLDSIKIILIHSQVKLDLEQFKSLVNDNQIFYLILTHREIPYHLDIFKNKEKFELNKDLIKQYTDRNFESLIKNLCQQNQPLLIYNLLSERNKIEYLIKLMQLKYQTILFQIEFKFVNNKNILRTFINKINDCDQDRDLILQQISHSSAMSGDLLNQTKYSKEIKYKNKQNLNDISKKQFPTPKEKVQTIKELKNQLEKEIMSNVQEELYDEEYDCQQQLNEENIKIYYWQDNDIQQEGFQDNENWIEGYFENDNFIFL